MDEILRLARPAILAMTPYSSARTEGRQTHIRVHLDANENPYPPYPGGDGQVGLNRYPEGQPDHLLERCAEHFGVPRSHLLFTRGADEAIDLLVRGFCSEGRDAAIVMPPTFAMYHHAAQVQGVALLDVPLTPGDFQIDADAVIGTQRAHPDAKLVFACSPNNPTGNLLARADIERIAGALFGRALVVVDELYLDYSGAESLATALPEHPNIVVLRSMSKEYSLAGERFGITIAHPEVVSILGRMLPPYPLAQTTIRAVGAVLSPEGMRYAQDKIARIVAERRRMAQVLDESPAVRRVFPSDANFLLVQVDDPRGLIAAMEDAGIKLRDRSTMPGAEGSVRIAVGTPEENDEMLAVLDRYAAGVRTASPSGR
ncbi:MAG TPA: histidinol-phosphate transaminase [Euzebyales bacterium]|nr:histidinol-phosphate transaminase [Euzebyales bacterium]